MPSTVPAGATDAFARRLESQAQRARRSTPPQPKGEATGTSAAADGFSNRLQQALTQRAAAPPPMSFVPPHSAEVGASVNEPAAPYGTGPVGGGAYVVRDGECLNSIAIEAGFFWETIWNDAANSELRSVRKDPDVLLPSDRVHIPEKRRKDDAGVTEVVHRFRRRGCPARLSVVFKHLDAPRAHEPYILNVDGKIQSGALDGDGRLDVTVPPGARQATLLVGEEREVHQLQLGGMHPISEVSGVQQRLNNLGFGCGAVDNVLSTRTRTALKRFQLAQKLEQTGHPDEPTVARLREAHGS